MSEIRQKNSLTPMRSRQMCMLITQNESYLSDKEEEVIDQDDETKKVAAQLTLIRKKHDKTKEANLKKRQYLDV